MVQRYVSAKNEASVHNYIRETKQWTEPALKISKSDPLSEFMSSVFKDKGEILLNHYKAKEVRLLPKHRPQIHQTKWQNRINKKNLEYRKR